jgi:hypothetical protein
MLQRTSLCLFDMLQVVLRSDQVMTFKRNESNYDVDIKHLTNDATRTDITYWLPNPSNFFDTYTTISMKADESNVLKPTIPIEVIDLLLHPRNKHEEREQNLNGRNRCYMFITLVTTVKEAPIEFINSACFVIKSIHIVLSNPFALLNISS